MNSKQKAIELTPLQKTIFNLAMYGGSVMLSDIGRFNLDSEYGNPPESYEPLKITNLCLENGKIEICAEHENGWSVGFVELEEIVPILHSFNKLTEPILDGGKVPIDEFFILFGGGAERKYEKVWKETFLNSVLYSPISSISYGIVDQLNIWGFNTENLPEGTFIEITSVCPICQNQTVINGVCQPCTDRLCQPLKI